MSLRPTIRNNKLLLTCLLRLTKFVAIWKDLGLLRTRQQGHSPETIREVMVRMREMYPNAGVREMIGLLFHEHDMAVSR